MKKFKIYKLSWEDKKGNVLKTSTDIANNIKDVRSYAKKLLAESNINDLHKIIVSRA